METTILPDNILIHLNDSVFILLKKKHYKGILSSPISVIVLLSIYEKKNVFFQKNRRTTWKKRHDKK